MTTTTQYISGSGSDAIKPEATENAMIFLTKPLAACQEAWVIAQGGVNNDGPLCLTLVDQYGRNLSRTTEIYSSQPARVKLQRVRIPSEQLPPVIMLRAVNKSTQLHSDAKVHGLMLIY